MSTFKFGFDLQSENNDDVDQEGREAKVHVCDGERREEEESSAKMPLSVIDMETLLTNMKCPHDKWSYSDIPLVRSTTCSANGGYTTTHLRRITHTEQPFDTHHDNDDHHDGDGDKHDEGSKKVKQCQGDEINISIMAQKNTDIIPGKYEGGLKVWECSIDLCNYLAEQVVHFNNDDMNHSDYGSDVRKALSSGGTTLELGCGHGLPGCLILKEAMKAKYPSSSRLPGVLFTDYNSFVLRDVTLPNIILNCNNDDERSGGGTMEKMMSMTGLVAGDWMELSCRLKSGSLLNEGHQQQQGQEFRAEKQMIKVPEDGRFDLILASETTYTESSAKDTAYWLFNHLKYNSGVGLVSMKRYYFGVGGGSDAFKKASLEFGLQVDLVREYNDGASNIRDLWRAQLKSKK